MIRIGNHSWEFSKVLSPQNVAAWLKDFWSPGISGLPSQWFMVFKIRSFNLIVQITWTATIGRKLMWQRLQLWKRVFLPIFWISVLWTAQLNRCTWVPCHSQAVERLSKQVSDAYSLVCWEKSSGVFIRRRLYQYKLYL